MSHPVNEKISMEIIDTMEYAWTIEGRPDLENDCFKYIEENAFSHEGIVDSELIMKWIIEFLSTHCGQAISSQDLEFMSKENKKGGSL
tara:strand:- start:43 stop:306 length:264 start_codon:yes stop_codon:yes gene_type:complete